MKKKLLAFALVACMAVIAIAGASLAYFTDTDTATNDFISGKVDITLNEVFDKETAQLIPGVDIEKDVTISLSADSVESYVWYTYAIPAVLDNANASLNIVHVNHAGRNWLGYQNDQKYWAEGQTEATPEDQCWIVDYKVEKDVEIDGVLYNVYTVLYNGTLEAGEETTIGMTKVYCDTKVDFDNESGEYTINGQPIGFDLNNVKIIVTAYGIQAATFDDVYAAYDAYTAQSAAVEGVAVDID
jgi:predicted ribosomally synthesized peptide with SipW-like signal peptide